LCWVHAERLVHQLIRLNERPREDQQRVRAEIWDLYADLKACQCHPEPTQAPVLEARFEAIFAQRTSLSPGSSGMGRSRLCPISSGSLPVAHTLRLVADATRLGADRKIKRV